MKFGTAEHAAEVTRGRQPGIQDGLQWLTFAHLPEALQKYSRPFYEIAVVMIGRIRTDSPELTTTINGLITAKDAAVRAGIRHDTGRAGSIPRPQNVVSPPKFQATESSILQPTPTAEAPTCPSCERPPGVPHASWCANRGDGDGFVPVTSA